MKCALEAVVTCLDKLGSVELRNVKQTFPNLELDEFHMASRFPVFGEDGHGHFTSHTST
jgi:hypothetical protein